MSRSLCQIPVASLFLISYQAVSLMGSGMTPQQAAKTAIDTIRRKYPDFKGAVVAANTKGEYGRG